MNKDFNAEELELLAEIDDPVWRENIHEKCVLRCQIQQPGIEFQEKLRLMKLLFGCWQRIKHLRSLHRPADDH